MNALGNNIDNSKTNKFVTTITLTSRRIILNFKSLTTNLTTLILLFIVPTLFCLTTVIIAPIRYNFGLIFSASLILMALITYGTVAGSFRRSTLNKNSNLTIGVRWIDNLATIGTMFLMCLIMATYILILIQIFDWMGILLVGMNDRSKNYDNAFITSINISIVYYNAILITLLTYSISYFFQGFFDSDMMFFTLGIIIFITLIVFGAVFNDYFYLSDITQPRGTDKKTIIIYNHNTTFGDGMYVPTLLYPFYVPSQMLRMNGELMAHPEYNSNILWTFLTTETDALDLRADLWRWNILWFVPYFNIIFWWCIGFTYKYFK